SFTSSTAVDEHADGQADLRGSQSGALLVPDRVRQVCQGPFQPVVKGGDRVSRCPKDRVAEEPDGEDGHAYLISLRASTGVTTHSRSSAGCRGVSGGSADIDGIEPHPDGMGVAPAG